ncbi:uncharacterized protein IUM83_12264 [Phytophthora cinnamomi]|uniref:uncharacterized protein n=1 Tax=Phytophthora cinnamomi TaxID=4785 RepID=UPI00355A2C70|nr:hypothetical protein IUM83_12264 [Phytophthora cinnamomi]
MPGEFAADFDHDTNAPTPGDEDEDELETSVNLEGEGSDACVARRVDARVSGGLSVNIPSPRVTAGTPPTSTSSSAAVTPAVGRPRILDKQSVLSVASPEGPMLLRNAERAAADARESERYKRLNTTSDRLVGRYLRVLLDNFEAMGGREPGTKSKRSAYESSVSTTYAASERMRAKTRMDSIDRELKRVEAVYASTGSEMKALLLFFRENADRRVEAEDKRRREEREERCAEEK